MVRIQKLAVVGVVLLGIVAVGIFLFLRFGPGKKPSGDAPGAGEKDTKGGGGGGGESEGESAGTLGAYGIGREDLAPLFQHYENGNSSVSTVEGRGVKIGCVLRPSVDVEDAEDLLVSDGTELRGTGSRSCAMPRGEWPDSGPCPTLDAGKSYSEPKSIGKLLDFRKDGERWREAKERGLLEFHVHHHNPRICRTDRGEDIGGPTDTCSGTADTACHHHGVDNPMSPTGRFMFAPGHC